MAGMIHDRFCSRLALGLLVAASTAAVAVCQAQTPQRANSAPRAPGVTRAIEHLDTSGPDATVDQTQPDEHQPATAVDHESGGPETAVDHERGGPETATDAPRPSSSRKAAAIARQGVRSNSPPAKAPGKPQS